MNQEIDAIRQARNRIAVQHGLPPIGASMINQYGIEWLVDGHIFAPTLASIARGHTSGEDPLNLHPVIIPQNLSPRLMNFLNETDLCTNKAFMPLDTMPFLRPQQAHPDGHWVDAWTDPNWILLFLDAAHVHETVIAHEIGHVWIDVVEDCEDYRMMKDLTNTAKAHHWTNIQSFVLDKKVNEVLRKYGFDMSIIETHFDEFLASLSCAVLSGYRPPTAYEAAFLASNIATAMLDSEAESGGALQSLDIALLVFQRDLPEVYELACQMAASIRRHGYSERAGIRNAIDECAALSFQFVGESYNPDEDLIDQPPAQSEEDKFPEWLSGLPIKAKLEVGRAMAKQRVPPATPWRLSYSAEGRVQVEFGVESGAWTEPVLLQHLHRLLDDFPFRGLHHPSQKGYPNMNKPVVNRPPVSPELPRVSPPRMPSPPSINPGKPLNMPPGINRMRRNYSVGLARFLSQTRLAEQLGGEHPYGYAMNNPITYTDPSGRRPACVGQRVIISGGQLLPKMFPCPGYARPCFREEVSKRIGIPFGPDPLQLIYRVMARLLYCLAQNESSFRPGAIGVGVNETAYGLFQLGDTEGARCGAGGQHPSDFGVAWQVRCALIEVKRACNKDNGSLLQAFKYWSGIANLVDKSGKPFAPGIADRAKLTACMAAAGYPNWVNFLDNLPCDPCQAATGIQATGYQYPPDIKLY